MNYYNPYQYNYGVSQAAPQTNTYAFVNGIEGAKSYLVQPNQTVLLMDSDAPMCYMKQANSMGQATIRAFKLEEVQQAQSNNQTQEYALKTDFQVLNDKLTELEKKLLNGGDNNVKSV